MAWSSLSTFQYFPSDVEPLTPQIPIAHPELVDYDPGAWSKIESEGLGGFTGITPLFRRRHFPPYRSPSSSNPASPSLSPTSGPAGSAGAGGGGVSLTIGRGGGGGGVSGATTPAAARTKSLGRLEKDEWYAVDVDYSGGEKKKWAGVEYESKGGREVGKMVRGLWDERGWECLWVSLRSLISLFQPIVLTPLITSRCPRPFTCF